MADVIKDLKDKATMVWLEKERQYKLQIDIQKQFEKIFTQKEKHNTSQEDNEKS